jgi:chromosome segregation ATPase
MIPVKQFKTADETKTTAIEADMKALKKELKSVEQLRKHIEERHKTGAMPDDTFKEQVEKLDARIKSLKKKMDKKQKELEALKNPA